MVQVNVIKNAIRGGHDKGLFRGIQFYDVNIVGMAVKTPAIFPS